LNRHWYMFDSSTLVHEIGNDNPSADTMIILRRYVGYEKHPVIDNMVQFQQNVTMAFNWYNNCMDDLDELFSPPPSETRADAEEEDNEKKDADAHSCTRTLNERHSKTMNLFDDSHSALDLLDEVITAYLTLTDHYRRKIILPKIQDIRHASEFTQKKLILSWRPLIIALRLHLSRMALRYHLENEKKTFHIDTSPCMKLELFDIMYHPRMSDIKDDAWWPDMRNNYGLNYEPKPETFHESGDHDQEEDFSFENYT